MRGAVMACLGDVDLEGLAPFLDNLGELTLRFFELGLIGR